MRRTFLGLVAIPFLFWITYCLAAEIGDVRQVNTVEYKKCEYTLLSDSNALSPSSIYARINSYRASKGLSPLCTDRKLEASATEKVNDMVARRYWSHNSSELWGLIRKNGFNYRFAGENLAEGFTASSDIVVAWKNSPDHDANLVSEKADSMGIAISCVDKWLEGSPSCIVVLHVGKEK